MIEIDRTNMGTVKNKIDRKKCIFFTEMKNAINLITSEK